MHAEKGEKVQDLDESKRGGFENRNICYYLYIKIDGVSV
jgi:hypothetical protein